MQPTKHFRKRDAILDYLRNTKAHPSAETIFTDLKPVIPDLAMGTVYRNLTLFKEQGLISSVATVRGVERFDATTDPHVHFICNYCDAVEDLHQLQMPESFLNAAQECCGGEIDRCELSFTGVCRKCTNIKKSGESA
ncbi:MAG: transcriptional repressor [Oscillospiraceae bacterium]|nr:transcriptional repressor [Oscillospiraceae bacterium]